MPIDPRIALGVQQFQAPNMLEMAQNAMAIRNAQQTNQLNQMRLAAEQQSMDESNALRNYLSSADLSTPEGLSGLYRYGTSGATTAKAVSERLKTEQETATSKAAEKKNIMDEAKARQEWLGQAFQNLSINPSNENIVSWVQDAVINGYMDQKQAASTQQQMLSIPVEQRPAHFKQMGMTGAQKSEAQRREEQTAIDKQQLEVSQAREAREAAQNIDNAPLSHAALVNAATMYNINGTLPPFGMGKNAASQKVAILNMASLLSQGVDPNDAAMIRISNKANQSALTDITKREAITGSFEKNFTKNVDIVDEYSGKVDRTGVPIVNKWIQSGKRAVTGDADLKAYDLAIKTVVNEYAKIINASTSSAATAVSEINDMKQKLAAADTPEAVAAVISVMKRETANRMQGYKEQKAELTRAFTPNKSITPPPPAGGEANVSDPLGIRKKK